MKNLRIEDGKIISNLQTIEFGYLQFLELEQILEIFPNELCKDVKYMLTAQHKIVIISPISSYRNFNAILILFLKTINRP